MRNPKQPRNVADRGRHGKKSARLTPKANGPSVATKRRRTGGRVFVFHKEDLGQAGDGGQWGRRGWPGRGRARAGGSGQGEVGRARLGPGTRPDEAPLQEETNCERVRLARRDKRQEAAMGSAGRSGSAATTRATSAQTDGAILADTEHAPDTAREKRSRVTEKARLLGDGAVPCQEATRTSGRVQGTNAATSGP